jgi:hypothetical protein
LDLKHLMTWRGFWNQAPLLPIFLFLLFKYNVQIERFSQFMWNALRRVPKYNPPTSPSMSCRIDLDWKIIASIDQNRNSLFIYTILIHFPLSWALPKYSRI